MPLFRYLSVTMKRGENLLFYFYKKSKICLILYYKIQLENFMKNLSNIAPASLTPLVLRTHFAVELHLYVVF
jgi:hypothetical protein